MYSEKATKICEIFTLLLTVCTVNSKVRILALQNFLAFWEYMNFKKLTWGLNLIFDHSIYDKFKALVFD